MPRRIGISQGDKMKQFAYKVPAGKLIKVKVLLESNRISEVIITGDFFLHPEEGLHEIEQSLKGSSFEIPEMAARIRKALESIDGQLIGVSPEDFALTIRNAIYS
ncbi:MAG: biotin--protein ligase [Candidatus Thorarchaeota archaeon]|nr:biotin--protein ligase [Candidatus Thorarchaeota archaeon]